MLRVFQRQDFSSLEFQVGTLLYQNDDGTIFYDDAFLMQDKSKLILVLAPLLTLNLHAALPKTINFI